MAEVKWIKVSTDMFDGSRKIKQIEMMPEGDTILVIWLKLLLLAGNVNDGGAIYLTPEIPYTDEMLATELRRPLNTVKMALTIFERFGMIEVQDDILHLASWEKYQNTEKLSEIREYNREAQRRSRERRRQLQAPKEDVNDNVNDMSMTSQPCHDIEEEREEEKESHSFIHSREEAKLKFLGGKLGKGVVMLSEEQMDSLLDELTIDEFNKYVEIVADAELRGKHYSKKTHYQAILDMVAKDRRMK